jgi:hypothetical protein
VRKHSHSPHIRIEGETLRNYNGVLEWSVESVQGRYRQYCRTLGVKEPNVPHSREHVEGNVRWIYPIMESVIEGIARGDLASAEIGVEFIQEDEHFVFGRVLKSNTARALRRTELTASQKDRLRTRIVRMLLDGYVPHEFHEYAKLLRHIGLRNWWPTIERDINRDNPYVMRYYRYFRLHSETDSH